MARFPTTRMRRLRRTSGVRRLFSEVVADKSKLVMPIFVQDGIKSMAPIESMPRNYRYPLRNLPQLSAQIEGLGIHAVLLFGLPSKKDAVGSGAYAKNGIVQQATRTIKENSGLTVMTDLCMCEYTSHGQCGIMKGGNVDNDLTLAKYSQIAVSQAEAGADVIAPSGMMDGQVARIRASLDENGYCDMMIMAYSAKMSSSFYGPFRDAAASAPKYGDRKSYQMNYSNAKEAMRELALDAAEGADVLMVKPALTNLDILHRAKMRFELPIAAYNVSGEYSALNAAAEHGWLNYEEAATEVLTSIFRAGADIVITYHAMEFAEWSRRGE